MSEKWNEFVNELLRKTDIVALISKYVPLKKRGASHWGCCPFHHEKTPSFSVSQAKSMFYCFGCQTGGNAITFLKLIESIEPYDAIKMLAQTQGIPLPERDEGFERESYESREKLKEKRLRLLALLKDCAIHYHTNLALTDAAPAMQYLTKRGIDKPMITRFGLGYSLGYGEAIEYLEKKGYTKEEMREAGVAAQKADRYYDVFARRLIVPIVEPAGLTKTGNVVGFGGRLLTDESFAKYINSPQGIAFDKSRTLFALNLVKKKRQSGELKHIIMAEGYMDVISLHKAGFDSAVASMGTSLTHQQANLLKNVCSNIYISYDGDAAGQKATLRGLDILEASGLSVRVIRLPEGEDPDDVIRKRGRDYYQRLMDNALPLTAFKIESLKKKYDLTTPEGKSGFAVEAVSVIKRLENPIAREEYLKNVQDATGYSMQVLYMQADLPEPDAPPEVKPVEPERAAAEQSAIDRAKEYVLSQLIAARPYADLSEDIFSLLEDAAYQRIFILVTDAIKNAEYTPGQLYLTVDAADEPLLSRLIAYEPLEGDDVVKYLGCIKLLKLKQLNEAKNELVERYKQTKDASLLLQHKEIDAKINDLKHSGG